MLALTKRDPRYPRAVLELPQSPEKLWVDGDADVLRAPAIAIVGTRRMTGYGERVAREIALAAARSGVVVVSGLAQGIDSAAHRGAIDGGGRTVAVLGESINVFLRSANAHRRQLGAGIRTHGALVSEFKSPFVATEWSFPRRNATIAALGARLVVVEAGVTSGALITARHARRLGRPVFAVPGPIGSTASVGTNRLIRSGHATALVDVSDLFGGLPGLRVSDTLLDLLRDEPLGLDELARRGRMSASAVTERVASLLLKGEVMSLPDGRLRRA